VSRLIAGSADWTRSGAPVGRVSIAPAMRCVPLGLLQREDAGMLFEDATALTRVTHKDPRAVAAAVGAAAAVAHLCGVDRIDEDRFTSHLAATVRPADEGTASALEELGRWAGGREDISALAHAAAALGKGTPRPDTGEGVGGAQVLLAALVALLRSSGDFLGCIGVALKAGGQTDQTAGLAGALAGAYAGAGGVPRHLAARVSDRGEHGHDEIVELGEKLHALQDRRQ
jgi:ADP-ribosylglycohydrolase